jgi:sugar lactone lactonase YvrE
LPLETTYRRRMMDARTVMLALTLSLAAGIGAASAQQLFCAVADSLPLPDGEVRGLAWVDGRRLAVLSAISDSQTPSGARSVTLIFIDRSGAPLRRQDFTGTLARGLAFDGEFFWSCGDERDGGSLLYKIDGDTLNVEESFPTPGHHPCGVAWDGESVWVVDRDTGRLDRFDPDKGDVTRSILTPGFSPYGLAHDGRFAWVADSGTGRLYRLAGARGKWDGTVDADAFSFRGRDLVMTYSNGFMWFSYKDKAVAYQLIFP